MLCSGPVGDVPGRSGIGDLSTEVERDEPASKWHAVVTRRLIPPAGNGGRPSRSDVPVLEHSLELLEQAFDNSMAVFECVSFYYCSHWFHIYMIGSLDQFSADPASTVIQTTGHQLGTLCKAVCEEEKAQILDLLMKSWYHSFSVPEIVLY